MSEHDTEAVAAIATLVARTGMQVSDDERERLVRLYPFIKGIGERLRMVEARYADPAMIYPAAVPD